jgi:hypothetical protein
MEHYSVSPDGRRVAFVSAARTGQPGVWLASTDGSFPPRRLSKSPGLQAFFGAPSEIIFAAQETDGTFAYRVKEDGGGMQKAIPFPIYFLYGVSPDGTYAAIWGAPPAEPTDMIRLQPLQGGAPMIICAGCAFRSANPQAVSWSPDGGTLYLALMGGSAGFSVPLRRGRIVPELPAGGFKSVLEVASLAGARPLAAPFTVPAPDPSVYVYSKLMAQRNIYRVPVR